jgi:hypothetical protein
VAGERYGYEIKVLERDCSRFDGECFDSLGSLVGFMSESNNWGGLGTQTHSTEYFRMEYDIRKAALPDLHATSMRVDIPGERPTPFLCSTVENPGSAPSDVAQLVLKVDTEVVSTRGLQALAPGESRDECDAARTLEDGGSTLSAEVDGRDAIIEGDETNNSLSTGYLAIPTSGLPTAQLVSDPTTQGNTNPPSQTGLIMDPNAAGSAVGKPRALTQIKTEGKANLIVESVGLRGTKDCDPGKNDVRVRVKNQGTGNAANVLVKLVVANSPDTSLKKSIKDLAAGEAEDVDFDDVQIKSGERELTATADADNTISESKDDNNARSITMSCKDE